MNNENSGIDFLLWLIAGLVGGLTLWLYFGKLFCGVVVAIGCFSLSCKSAEKVTSSNSSNKAIEEPKPIKKPAPPEIKKDVWAMSEEEKKTEEKGITVELINKFIQLYGYHPYLVGFYYKLTKDSEIKYMECPSKFEYNAILKLTILYGSVYLAAGYNLEGYCTYVYYGRDEYEGTMIKKETLNEVWKFEKEYLRSCDSFTGERKNALINSLEERFNKEEYKSVLYYRLTKDDIVHRVRIPENLRAMKWILQVLSTSQERELPIYDIKKLYFAVVWNESLNKYIKVHYGQDYDEERTYYNLECLTTATNERYQYEEYLKRKEEREKEGK